MPGSASVTERRQDYAEFTSAVTRVLEILQAQGSTATTNAAQLRVVLDTTSEIKEQLTIMNGRVRQNSMDIVAIKSNPPLTRNHCDKQHTKLEEEWDKLSERIRELEGKVPSIIQNIVVAVTTGGTIAIASHFLSRVP